MNSVVSYKCPNCSAPLSFNIDEQNWLCRFCNSEFTIEDMEKRPVTEDIEYGEWHETNTGEYGENTVVYTCPSCGGKILTDENTVATFCVYCHNPAVIASRLEKERRPAYILPFKLDKDYVLQAMAKLMKRRPLLPKSFRELAGKGEISGLYVPFWLFGADIEGFAAARGEIISHWSDSKYNYTKIDTYLVERAAEMSFDRLPADASRRMEDALMQALEPFDYSSIKEFDMSYLSGHYAEGYDVESREASEVAFKRISKGTDKVLRELMAGYTTIRVISRRDNIKTTRCSYVMLPVWTLSTAYKSKNYIFAMNGQTGKMVGKLPLSIGRLLAWFGGLSAAVTAVVFVGGILFL